MVITMTDSTQEVRSSVEGQHTARCEDWSKSQNLTGGVLQ